MGNRAVVAFGTDTKDIGIYVHWNGGEESVRAFLDAAKHFNVRAGDQCYAAARIAQIIGNFFGGTLSLGIGTRDTLECDNFDNGTYVVNDSLDIVKREFCHTSAKSFDQKRYKAILAEVIAINDPIFNRKES